MNDSSPFFQSRQCKNNSIVYIKKINKQNKTAPKGSYTQVDSQSSPKRVDSEVTHFMNNTSLSFQMLAMQKLQRCLHLIKTPQMVYICGSRSGRSPRGVDSKTQLLHERHITVVGHFGGVEHYFFIFLTTNNEA